MSRSVTSKQGHELITGPYAVVRHPIYTGILGGFLGTAIALSQVRGFIVFVLILTFRTSWFRFARCPKVAIAEIQPVPQTLIRGAMSLPGSRM